MTNFYRRLFLQGKTRSVGILASGILVGQLAILLATPLLTHLINPDAFGIYAVILASLNILATIATLRFELSIPIPEAEDEAFSALILSLLTTLTLALTLGTILMVSPELISYHFSSSMPIDVLLWVLPIGLLLSGIQQSLTYWSIRASNFLRISQSRGSYGIVTAGTQITLGLSGLGFSGLAGGEIVGRLSACLWLFSGIDRQQSKTLLNTVTAKSLYATARKFKGFALLSTLSSLINTLSIYLPTILIMRFLGSYEVGLYFLAQRIIGFPTALLISSISQVFVADFSRTKYASERATLYRDTIKQFAILTGPIFLIIGISSNYLFPYIFGAEWESAGKLAMLLAPFYFLQLLSGSTISALDILQAHGIRLLREVIFLAGTAAVISASYFYSSTAVAIIGSYVIFGVIFYSMSLFFVYHIILRTNSL